MPALLLVFVVAYFAAIIERTRLSEIIGATVWMIMIFTGPLLLVLWALASILSR